MVEGVAWVCKSEGKEEGDADCVGGSCLCVEVMGVVAAHITRCGVYGSCEELREALQYGWSGDPLGGAVGRTRSR